MGRTQDRAKRKTHPNSLANLTPGPPEGGEFQPGNPSRMTHGADTERVIAPLAEAYYVELVAEFPGASERVLKLQGAPAGEARPAQQRIWRSMARFAISAAARSSRPRRWRRRSPTRFFPLSASSKRSASRPTQTPAPCWRRSSRTTVTTPLEIVNSLRLTDGRRWGDAAYPWQREDVEAILDPDPDSPPYHFQTRSRGSSKTDDTAAALLGHHPHRHGQAQVLLGGNRPRTGVVMPAKHRRLRGPDARAARPH